MIRSTMRSTLVPLMAGALLLAAGSSADARASATATAPFRIKYGVATSTRFQVLGDGRVTVTNSRNGFTKTYQVK